VAAFVSLLQDKKPVLEVDSQWEDIDYRIKSLNALRVNGQVLKAPTEQLENMLLRRDVREEEKEKLMTALLDALAQFTRLSRTPLPPLPNTCFTRLDDNLANIRQMARVAAAEEASDLARLLHVSGMAAGHMPCSFCVHALFSRYAWLKCSLI